MLLSRQSLPGLGQVYPLQRVTVSVLRSCSLTFALPLSWFLVAKVALLPAMAPEAMGGFSSIANQVRGLVCLVEKSPRSHVECRSIAIGTRGEQELFEQALKNIDDVSRKEAGCTTEPEE